MKTVSIVLMLALAGPAFAETPAAPALPDKPFILDAPPLKNFSPPRPVTVQSPDGSVTQFTP